MKKRIAFMSYPRLTSLAERVLAAETFQGLCIIESSFEETISKAGELINKELVDVFISGGSNARILKETFPGFPVVTLNVTGFDLMAALAEARKLGNAVAVITYKEGIPELENFKDLLKIRVVSKIFRSQKELEDIVKELKSQGIDVLIGSSIVCDYGDKYGLKTVFIYSERSLKEAIDRAIDLQQTIRAEKKRSNQLRAIIDFAYSGIIAIDEEKRVNVYNPVAEKILGIPREKVLNQRVDHVIPNTRLDKVLEIGVPEINQIQKIGESSMILTNRIPIIVDGTIVGAVATFQDVVQIQEAEQHIRRKLYEKGLAAKYTFNDIIGNSRAIRKARELAKIYAKSESTVLIYGETGTGKELFAHSIHSYSNRSDKPFIALNCAALPESLLESELFGYEEGAFTGARKGGKPGLFELAHQGTLFLDEISEMPMRLQARLLRVLQEKEILRIGGDRIIPVDVRIIAATNKDLWQEVKKGKFREDLYYRLNVLYLGIPPLRERIEDIPVLVKEMVMRNSAELLKIDNYTEIWEQVIKRFMTYTWPGNVRQLENAVQTLCAILKNGNVNDHDRTVGGLIEQALDGKFILTAKSEESRSFSERERIINALNTVGWNRHKAAGLLGISRTTLWRKMKELNIKAGSETIS
ncbi:propionate catabolism operon regulatory protein PrpR [Calderihabitans maritimus]|uniref:PAS domain S-box n=1 Tax=Calderihabitans maritimus TaxID=1246530 RepID=A0A1Z5HS25_9FIRM|nr:propionate catabolism operon regulatory protein PrpR [Calderihabitans maritimus]GAW92329.1 PAS domain S-box [Calderihabitans maritimus]